MRRGRNVGRAIAAVVVAVGVVVTPTVAVQADDAPPSDWWYDGFGVAEVQADGWTGAGVKIAVIDNQINPDLPVFDGTDLTVADPLCPGSSPTSTSPSDGAVHGSDVTALLIGNGKGNGHVRGIAPDAQVTFYGVASCKPTGGSGPSPLYVAIERAVESGARVITMSLTTTTASRTDAQIIADAENAGVVMVAASPNTANDDDEMWPWEFNGIVSVNAFGKDGKLQTDHEIPGKRVAWAETTVVAPGVNFPSVDWSGGQFAITGSSMATPLTAGIIAVTAQKYPKATARQLIQSLIHNTTPDDHALSHKDDGSGYGPVSLRHMLRVDPTQYPSENPLMDKASGTPSEVRVTKSPSPSAATTLPTEKATTPALAGADAGVWTPVLIGVGVVMVLVIVAVIVIVIVASARTKNKKSGGAV